MTRLITTVVFVLTVLTANAQYKDNEIFIGNLVSDTATFKNNDYRKALPSILKSKNKIEVRFIESPSFAYTSYIVLSFDKKWTANYFYYKPGKDSLLRKDITKKAN